ASDLWDESGCRSGGGLAEPGSEGLGQRVVDGSDTAAGRELAVGGQPDLEAGDDEVGHEAAHARRIADQRRLAEADAEAGAQHFPDQRLAVGAEAEVAAG